MPETNRFSGAMVTSLGVSVDAHADYMRYSSSPPRATETLGRRSRKGNVLKEKRPHQMYLCMSGPTTGRCKSVEKDTFAHGLHEARIRPSLIFCK